MTQPAAPVLADRAREAFDRDGFISVPGLLSPDEVERYLERLELLSGLRRDTPPAASKGWTVPDGVTRHPEFWDVIFHERLVAVVRSLLGADIRFLQHNDLHVGFSSFNWHRDSVSRVLGVGPDWDESTAPYRIVRVGMYLQSSGGSFKLGLVPGTHRVSDPRAQRARAVVERKAGWLSHARRLLTGRIPEVPGAQWVPASAGDAVIFDPRVLHTGTPVDGAKYSMFVAYGVPNEHFAHHSAYYRHTRTDLGYEAMRAPLVERLRAAGMYADTDATVAVDGTLPSVVETLVMRARRKQ